MESVKLKVLVQADDFDTQYETELIADGRSDIGAIVTFTGLCRDEGGKLEALELEHYHDMASAELHRIAIEALSRWPLHGLTVIHRYGKIKPGENIVLVLAAAAHRRAAFEAADFIMDYLKSTAPFWKKEHMRANKTSKWVDARKQDIKDMHRWRNT